MADSYLKLARQILEVRARPMSAQEILEDGRRFDELPKHLSGATMVKTLQARIAEDIASRRQRSDFYRIGQGQYFLRRLATDPTLDSSWVNEFKGAERRKPYPSERILFVVDKWHESSRRTIEVEDFLQTARLDSLYTTMEKRPNSYCYITTFSALRFDNMFLCFGMGRYSHFPDLLGLRSVGFRRLVDEYDLDLMVDDELGFALNASREILSNIKVTGDPVDDREIRRRAKMLGVSYEREARRISLILEFNLDRLDGFSGELMKRHGVLAPAWICRDELPIARLDEVSKVFLSI